jgi:O-antigen ligase
VRIPVRSTELGSALLKLFLVLVFFVHYQTIGIPGTLHSWVLVAGLAATLPRIIRRVVAADFKLPLDYAVVAFLALVIVLGFLANFGDSTVSQLQAYLLALACYVFVRENMSALPESFLPRLIVWFLLINSALILLQFATGEFYPARYLAAGDPELRIASGVSDGPTKNGMLMAFGLCVIFARFLLGQSRSRSGAVAVLSIGVLGLILSASRAGLVGFSLGALVCWVYVTFAGKRRRIASRRSTLVTYGLAVAVMILFVRIIIEFPRWGGATEYGYAANVVAYKLGQREDDSIGQRFQTVATAASRIRNNPVSIFGLGFGVGSFEKNNEGLNVHNSYVEFLFEAGLAGFLAFVFLNVHVIRKAFARAKYTNALPILAGLVAIMGFMAFHDVLRGRMYWIPLGILASLAYHSTSPRARVARAASAPAS